MNNLITLNGNSPSILYLKNKDKRLAKVIDLVGPISYVPYEDGFAFLVHEIIEQMLSIKAGQKIYSRLEDLCDGHISPSALSLLSVDSIKSTGTSNPKAHYIKNLVDAVQKGTLNLENLPSLSDSEVMNQLTALKGIGTWTAKMYLIFVLNRDNILPYEDGAWLQTYRWMYKTEDCSPESIKKRCKKWAPYTSIGSRYLYRALDLGLTKEEFHLFKEG